VPGGAIYIVHPPDRFGQCRIPKAPLLDDLEISAEWVDATAPTAATDFSPVDGFSTVG
jgi:hypothetical protein